MGGRSALVASASVAYGVASSYALLALVDPYEPGGDHWLVAYLVLGAAVSIVVGAAIARWWALLLPLSVPLAAAPAPDVLEQLPLWALVVACVPFATVGMAFGWAVRRLARRPNALDAIWAAIATLILVYPVGIVAGIIAGYNPWEDPEGPALGVFSGAAAGTVVVFGAIGAVAVVLGLRRPDRAQMEEDRHRAEARHRTRASSGVSEPGSTR